MKILTTLTLTIIINFLFLTYSSANTIKIVTFGDSNIAGFGVKSSETFGHNLQLLFGNKVQIINAGISGDTTESALRRIDTITSLKPNITIVFLGRNDLRQKIDIEITKRNLSIIIEELLKNKSKVILVGFYTRDFFDISKKYNISYYPDFFYGVSHNGIKYKEYILRWDPFKHLNAAAYKKIANNMFPLIKSQLEEITK